jgi:hypothetical protein
MPLFVYWKGLEPSELLEFDSHLVAQSTLRRIDPRKPEDFDCSAQHRHAAATTSTTRITPQSRMLRQIGNANDNFNNSSRLETSRERAANYSATSTARSKTSRNQLRLVGSIDKSHMDQNWFEAVQPRTLSALEEDLDHPPPLGEGESHRLLGGYGFRQLLESNYSCDPGSGKGIRLVGQVWASEGA